MLYEYILALAFLNTTEAAPQLVAAMKTQEMCMVNAAKLNARNADLQTPQARAVGAEYVCLKIERVNI